MNKLAGEARVPGAQQNHEPQGHAVDVIGDSVGMGFESVTAQDLLVPRLLIAQKQSPQLNPQDAAYIQGANEGSIIDSGASVAMDAVLFVPVLYKKSWIEWAPRTEQRGIVKVYDSPAILERCQNQGGKWIFGKNTIAETAQFYGYRIDGDSGLQPAFIAMPGSQLRTAKKWLHMAMTARVTRADGTRVQPPLWWFFYRLTTIQQSNTQGSWFGWVVERAGQLPDAASLVQESTEGVAEQCKSLHGTVLQGLAKPNFVESNNQQQIESQHHAAPFDDEVPF